MLRRSLSILLIICLSFAFPASSYGYSPGVIHPELKEFILSFESKLTEDMYIITGNLLIRLYITPCRYKEVVKDPRMFDAFISLIQRDYRLDYTTARGLAIVIHRQAYSQPEIFCQGFIT